MEAAIHAYSRCPKQGEGVICLIGEDFDRALKRTFPSALREVRVEVPEVSAPVVYLFLGTP